MHESHAGKLVDGARAASFGWRDDRPAGRSAGRSSHLLCYPKSQSTPLSDDKAPRFTAPGATRALTFAELSPHCHERKGRFWPVATTQKVLVVEDENDLVRTLE